MIKLPVSLADSQLRIAQLERELHWAQLKIQVLEERLRQRRIHLLGPHSETLSNLQLELLADEEPSATSDEVEAEAKREAITKAPRRERKPHPGRERLPENLPRVERLIRCEEKQCVACGHEMSLIGYDESEQLDVEPARYYVRVTKREKRACHACQQGTVTMAPLEPRIVEKGLASDAVVIDTIVAKYCDHLPLYRQAHCTPPRGLRVTQRTDTSNGRKNTARTLEEAWLRLYVSQGLRISTPRPWKSFTFRVKTIRPCSRAVTRSCRLWCWPEPPNWQVASSLAKLAASS
jgi:transposase